MYKVFLRYGVIGVVVVGLFCVPTSMFAAELTFKMIPNSETGDRTTQVEVRIDPQSKKLNVVEGEIRFSGTSSDNLLVQVENGQSVLPIWPIPPVYDKEKKSISFTGGVPSGFDSEGLLFRLRLSSTVSGVLTMSYINGNAYLNDGKGTKEPVSSMSFDITIDKDGQHQAPFNGNTYTYGILVLLVIAVLIVIFKFVLKKNDPK